MKSVSLLQHVNSSTEGQPQNSAFQRQYFNKGNSVIERESTWFKELEYAQRAKFHADKLLAEPQGCTGRLRSLFLQPSDTHSSKTTHTDTGPLLYVTSCISLPSSFRHSTLLGDTGKRVWETYLRSLMCIRIKMIDLVNLQDAKCCWLEHHTALMCSSPVWSVWDCKPVSPRVTADGVYGGLPANDNCTIMLSPRHVSGMSDDGQLRHREPSSHWPPTDQRQPQIPTSRQK